MENVEEVRKAIAEKRCMFGTVDTWLVWVSNAPPTPRTSRQEGQVSIHHNPVMGMGESVSLQGVKVH